MHDISSVKQSDPKCQDLNGVERRVYFLEIMAMTILLCEVIKSPGSCYLVVPSSLHSHSKMASFPLIIVYVHDNQTWSSWPQGPPCLPVGRGYGNRGQSCKGIITFSHFPLARV